MSDLFDKLASQEANFLDSEFLSPVLRNKPIRVRIAGVVMTLDVVRPKNFEGWGVFRPLSYKEARRVRNPDLAERQEYLKLFPCVRFILCRRVDKQWLGIPANNSDSRFKITGLVPIYLMEEVQLFDVVRTGFDGKLFWFEGIDPRRSPRTAQHLRDSLVSEVDPKKIELPGLTQEEKDAYLIGYNDLIEERKDKVEEHIKRQLAHSGAKYKSYIERGNTYTVEYMVDGTQQRSVIDKDTFTVQSAGICLAGHDRNFDLASLVDVIREGMSGRGRGYYHRTDDIYDPIDEADYDGGW